MNARGWMRRTVLTALVAALAACGDDGPSGPGTVGVEITGDLALGAVTVDLVGTGIEGASVGAGDWVASTDRPDGVRVVAVSREGGTIRFAVQVADLAAPLPTATVVQASTANGIVLPSTNGIRTTFVR